MEGRLLVKKLEVTISYAQRPYKIAIIVLLTLPIIILFFTYPIGSNTSLKFVNTRSYMFKTFLSLFLTTSFKRSFNILNIFSMFFLGTEVQSHSFLYPTLVRKVLFLIINVKLQSQCLIEHQYCPHFPKFFSLSTLEHSLFLLHISSSNLLCIDILDQHFGILYFNNKMHILEVLHLFVSNLDIQAYFIIANRKNNLENICKTTYRASNLISNL